MTDPRPTFCLTDPRPEVRGTDAVGDELTEVILTYSLSHRSEA